METQSQTTTISGSLQKFIFEEPVSVQSDLAISCAVQDILTSIGEDPQRQGLVKTPERVARMYSELTAGYQTDPVQLVNGALFDVDYDERCW
jgi:GTP cyclohydrolase I